MLTPLEQRLKREEEERLAFFALSPSEQKKAQVKNFLLYKENKWAFLRDCVWTQDQVDSKNPIKPYPSHLPYARLLTLLFDRELLTAIPKSRRMTASWTYIALYLHDTMFNSGRHNAFVSKKELDSLELVRRAEFIYKSIPEWRIPRELLPKVRTGTTTQKPPMLDFEEIGSKIQGFPQGEDQLRQFTLSGILEDECAFWDDAEGSFAGAKPTTDGGGRLTLISSRAPSFFKKVVFDQLDSPDLNFPEIPPAEVKSPMTGVEIWKNPKNRFLVIDLHYTANPEKQSPEWRETIKGGMPTRKFLMEYEKNWETFEGKPVFEDFIKGTHSVPARLKAQAGNPLIICWDFGLTPAALICQLDGPQLRVLEEHIGAGSIDKLAAKVWSHLSIHYNTWTLQPDMIFCPIDPAGGQRSQTDEKTCAQMLVKAGFRKIIFGPIDFETRRSAVEHFLTGQTKQGPNLLVSEIGCPTLVQGFTGGYKYADTVYEKEPTKARPLKNNYSHPHDALQYGAAFARGKQKQQPSGNIEAPSYGFQKR